MTTDFHDPIASGAPANSAVINAPLAQLDQAIKDIDFTPSGNPDEFLNGNKTFSVPAGTGSTNGHVIQEEGVGLAQKGNLDFQGASVKVLNGATATEVVINGAVLAKNTETLTGEKTLTDADAPVQFLDPGGSDQTVKLPANAAANPFFIFANTADDSEKLVIKNNAGTVTIVEVGQGEVRIVFSDGTSSMANTAGSGGGTSSPLTTKGDLHTFTITDARLGVGSNGQRLTPDSSQATGLKWADDLVGINLIIGDGTNVISTGIKGFLEIPYNMVITSVRLFANASGSVVIDIWKDTYTNFPPTDADSITASAPPTLSSAQKSENTTLTSWATSLSAGDVLAFNVDSAATVKQVTLSIRGKKA